MPKREDRFSPHDRKRRLDAIREALARDPIARDGYHRGFRGPNTFVHPDDAGDVSAIVYTTYAPRSPDDVKAKGGQAVLAVGVARSNFAECVEHIGRTFVLGACVDGEMLTTAEVWALLELDDE